jgi:hypothetical protein
MSATNDAFDAAMQRIGSDLRSLRTDGSTPPAPRARRGRPPGPTAKTQRILDAAIEVIGAASARMTVRQVYYQLVSRQVIENNRSQYQAVSKLLVDARRDGTVGWDAIEDRNRKARHVNMWVDLADYARSVRAGYRRDVWNDQDNRVEVWLEKDALSGIFSDVLKPYGVTLNVGRGYDGWSSIYEASERLGGDDVILYFGDFDPSGEDMVRSLEERLNDLGSYPTITKCALTHADITTYNLPADFAKATDTRSARFVAKYGRQSSVELDALPIDVLRDRLRTLVEDELDLDALEKTRITEAGDRERMVELLKGAS